MRREIVFDFVEVMSFVSVMAIGSAVGAQTTANLSDHPVRAEIDGTMYSVQPDTPNGNTFTVPVGATVFLEMRGTSNPAHGYLSSEWYNHESSTLLNNPFLMGWWWWLNNGLNPDARNYRGQPKAQELPSQPNTPGAAGNTGSDALFIYPHTFTRVSGAQPFMVTSVVYPVQEGVVYPAATVDFFINVVSTNQLAYAALHDFNRAGPQPVWGGGQAKTENGALVLTDDTAHFGLITRLPDVNQNVSSYAKLQFDYAVSAPDSIRDLAVELKFSTGNGSNIWISRRISLNVPANAWRTVNIDLDARQFSRSTAYSSSNRFDPANLQSVQVVILRNGSNQAGKRVYIENLGVSGSAY